jgi:Uma2 family endonuclease
MSEVRAWYRASHCIRSETLTRWHNVASVMVMIHGHGVATKRWTRVQYERAIECGIFRDDERLELLDGVLVVKEPQSDPHLAAIDLVAGVLRRVFGEGWLVRQQAHFASGRLSRPEPDVYVVPGSPRDYVRSAPTRPVLIVEVSKSRLGFDRRRKSAIYARAGVQDYWIVNLVDSVVEVRRDPGRLAPPSRGRGYRSVETVRPPSAITPLALPGVSIAVADLLP